MKLGFVLLVTVALLAMPGASQRLNVYSEFAQIDGQGIVVAPETPREILSPALVRNGFTTFQVVVQAPPDMSWVLRVGQNPDNAAAITLYRGASGHLVRAAEPVKGSSTETFWMDVWVDKVAPVRRIKVEPTVEIEGEWLTYPMEMRVRENIVPDFASNPDAAAEPVSPFEILQAYVCKGKQPAAVSTAIASPDAIHLRNAHQDVAMASQLSTVDRDELRKWMGGCAARASSDPEAYLHVRDYFFTPLWMKVAR